MSFKKWPILLSIATFLASLAMPTVATFNGLTSLISGPVAFFVDWQWGFVWLANVFYIFAVARSMAFEKPKLNILLCLIPIGLASISFFLPNIMVNEGGGHAYARLHYGFFVWMGSFVILTVYNLGKSN